MDDWRKIYSNAKVYGTRRYNAVFIRVLLVLSLNNQIFCTYTHIFYFFSIVFPPIYV